MNNQVNDLNDLLKKDLYEMGISSEILDRLLLLVENKVDSIINQPIDVKIMRTLEARMFDLPKPKKDGDVGFDIPAILPYKQEFADISVRTEYRHKRYKETNYELDELVLEREMREVLTIQPHELAKIATGIRLELPSGYWSAIEARSSTSNMKVIVPKGVIDGGYRGEFFANLINIGSEPIVVQHGDRVIQFIVHKNYTQKFNVHDVDELSETQRGDTGFGSTGRSESAISN